MGFTDHLSRDQKRLLQNQKVVRLAPLQTEEAQQAVTTRQSSAAAENRGNALLIAFLFTLGITSLFVVFHKTENIASAATPDFVNRGATSSAARIADLNRAIPDAGLSFPNRSKGSFPSRAYPLPKLDKVNLDLGRHGRLTLDRLPNPDSVFSEKVVGMTGAGELVYLTVDQKLQNYVESILDNASASEVAIVAMEPHTGKVLAMAGKSRSVKNITRHAGFPAASLFKLVTSAAALERGVVEPYSQIKFRGGTYTLNQWNYNPDSKKDKRSMHLAEALGRSCNPVFARVALKHLSADALRRYAKMFGFNTPLHFDLPVEASTASIPSDAFGLSRAAAGFGDVTISPIHAAALMSGIANGGMLPRPNVVEKVVSQDGAVLYESRPEALQRIVRPGTSRKLLKMMEYTTTVGTSKREFISKGKRILPVSVAAKTGTLRGKFPAGINNWFVAAAPLQNPEVAIAVVVVNPSVSSKASRLGRMVLQKALAAKH